MARENQGLQIALIILFMLTIILGVTTYIFCSQYIEAAESARNYQAQATQNEQAARNTQQENNELKKMILGEKDAQEKDLAEVTAQFNTDMETFGGGLEDVYKFYRLALEQLYKLANKKNTELADANDALQALQSKYDQETATMQKQVAEHEAARSAAEKKLKDTDTMYTAGLTEMRTEKEKIKTDWEAARDEALKNAADLKKQLDDAGTENKKQIDRNERIAGELLGLKQETFEVPDGEITWVDQRSGTVWINLGRRHALKRQTTFSVYPIDMTNLAKANKKASIEVTRIRGEEAAEARIVEDIATDPIMPGDKINTPVWSPGEQRRFALVGFMDLDQDGKNDLNVVADLIRISGGRVDCTINEAGEKTDDMTINTRYLVLGEAADAERMPNTAKDYSKVITAAIDEAKKYGLQQISYQDLLKQMGWKDQARVVPFGRDANPRDFRPKPPEGIPQVSTGAGSDSFKPRRPSAGQLSPRSGAY